MIQEKDFLYRVPVKTAPITTPGGQIRNPEILVDLEGGEFMHGNILDANSTNKLVDQSVKEAVDNKLNESGYVTKDLLEAETTRATEQENSLKTLIGAETGARTKGDEDLSSKIKAEQTRAEGKEKEISDKLAIVNGDSNTEGSFRKAIADVVAAAPEDLDTLKEIADKLAGNDDLHTALNQAITEKADASALLNEVTRATGVENNLKTAIDGKQPKGNYLTEHQSLEEYAKKTELPVVPTKVSQLTNDSNFITAADVDFTPYATIVNLSATESRLDTRIDGKQDKGNYIPYLDNNNHGYTLNGDLRLGEEPAILTLSNTDITFRGPGGIAFTLSSDAIEINNGEATVTIDPVQISSTTDEKEQFKISSTGIIFGDVNYGNEVVYGTDGITVMRYPDCIPTTDGAFIPRSNFVTMKLYNEKIAALEARIAALEAKHPEATA